MSVIQFAILSVIHCMFHICCGFARGFSIYNMCEYVQFRCLVRSACEAIVDRGLEDGGFWGAGLIMMPQGKRVSFGNLPRLLRHDTGTEYREIFTQALCSVWGSVGAETLPAGLLLTWWNRQRGERSQGQVKPEARKREEQSCSAFCYATFY